ncbi:MAG: hypothetical protein ACTHKJ_03395, partial [Candidatus Nitrosocosmicus sp.]
MTVISTVLAGDTSPIQIIHAQNNNDLASQIQQGVNNQIGNTFSNTPLGSSNFGSQQQQSSSSNLGNNLNNNNNNILSQSDGSSSITNNNAPPSSPSILQQQQQQATGSANIINNNNPAAQSNTPIGNNFIISGPLSSFLSTPSGNWVVNGSWALKVQNGNLSFFRGFMQWDPTNITKLPHTHSFVNFRADQNSQSSISLGPDRVVDIKGIMDIGANNKIEWTDVPAEIKTAGN